MTWISFPFGKRKSWIYFSWLHRCFCKVRCCAMATLETLRFDNLALKRLPIDSEERNYVRAVTGACFSKVKPTPVKNPRTVAYSVNAMNLLDLPVTELERREFPEYFSGNRLLPGSDPAAHCYCGHQFGYFSGQLGDGAAMYLGEILNCKNERWEIQLKGAGLTPYSRSADGRKVMRSSIREFLCSEAMHFLGVPSTRAGACITSDSEVVRDIFYDGHPVKEKCTVVLRLAPTFLRFGSFEIFKTLDPVTRHAGPSVGRTDILKQLLDYTIEVIYPQIHADSSKNREEKYSEFFKQVVLRTAQLVSEWQCVGFCHGVLNTDNMSVIGLTLDYGPFGFMDMYNPDYICNASDDGGRYSYKRQPEMCLWNLKKFAEAIDKAVPLAVTTPLLDYFEPEYKSCYLNKMRKKLGLTRKHLPDDDIVQNLLSTMENTGADFTNTFRCLSILELPGLATHESSIIMLKKSLLDQCYPLAAIVKSLKNGMDSRNVQMLLLLSRTNPEFAQRLGHSGLNLNAVISKMERAESLEKMSPEEKRRQDSKLWNDWIDLYIKRLEKEAQSCADENELKELQHERRQVMNTSNPRFILRNYIAQSAIVKAETGDFSEVNHVLKLLENPFDDNYQLEVIEQQGTSTSKVVDDSVQSSSHAGAKTFVEQLKDCEKLPPEWAFGLKVT